MEDVKDDELHGCCKHVSARMMMHVERHLLCTPRILLDLDFGTVVEEV